MEQQSNESAAKRPFDIAVLMAVHNRRALTLRALESLANQTGSGVEFTTEVYLVDDGSSDGTSEAVATHFPAVHIHRGNGDLFWSGAMARAQALAQPSDPDALLWLNDDVSLESNSVLRAVELVRSLDQRSIVVGATISSQTREVTYTGVRRRGMAPGALAPVLPVEAALPIDTFNGNFVMVPRVAFERVGSLDAHFVHAYGDIDYGLRATSAGITSYLMPGFIGFCEANPAESKWTHPGHARLTRLKMLFSRKGYPPGAHFRFNIKHAGVLGPLFALASYVRATARILRGA